MLQRVLDAAMLSTGSALPQLCALGVLKSVDTLVVELNCKPVVSFLLRLSDLQSRLRGPTTSNDVVGPETWKI